MIDKPIISINLNTRHVNGMTYFDFNSVKLVKIHVRILDSLKKVHNKLD